MIQDYTKYNSDLIDMAKISICLSELPVVMTAVCI